MSLFAVEAACQVKKKEPTQQKNSLQFKTPGEVFQQFLKQQRKSIHKSPWSLLTKRAKGEMLYATFFSLGMAPEEQKRPYEEWSKKWSNELIKPNFKNQNVYRDSRGEIQFGKILAEANGLEECLTEVDQVRDPNEEEVLLPGFDDKLSNLKITGSIAKANCSFENHPLLLGFLDGYSGPSKKPGTINIYFRKVNDSWLLSHFAEYEEQLTIANWSSETNVPGFPFEIDIIFPPNVKSKEFIVSFFHPRTQEEMYFPISLKGNRLKVRLPSIHVDGSFFLPKIYAESEDYCGQLSIPTYQARRVSGTVCKLQMEKRKYYRFQFVTKSGISLEDCWFPSPVGLIQTSEHNRDSTIVEFSVPISERMPPFHAMNSEALAATVWTPPKPNLEPGGPITKIVMTHRTRQEFIFVDNDQKPIPGLEITFRDKAKREIGIPRSTRWQAVTNKDGIAEVWFTTKQKSIPQLSFANPNIQYKIDPNNPLRCIVQRHKRQKFSGRVHYPKGFKGPVLLNIASNSPNSFDFQQAICDENGNFFVKVIPGREYSISVYDDRWASNRWQSVLIDEKGAPASPNISLISSTKVQLNFTGESKLVSGVQFFVKSTDSTFATMNSAKFDDNGESVVYLKPGPASIQLTLKNGKHLDQQFRVPKKESCQIDVPFKKKERGDKKTVSGTIRCKGVDLEKLFPIDLELTSLAGKSAPSKKLKIRKKNFSFPATKGPYGLYARTKDRKWSCFMAADFETTNQVSIELRPTGRFMGRIIDNKGSGVAQQQVLVQTLSPGIFTNENIVSVPSFWLDSRQVVTDKEGRFQLSGLPVGSALHFSFNRPSEMVSGNMTVKETAKDQDPILLELIDIRLRKPIAKKSLRQSQQELVQFASDYQMRRVIVLGNTSTDRIHLDSARYFATTKVAGFQLIPFYQNGKNSKAVDVFLKQKRWEWPEEESVRFLVVDHQDNPIDEIEIKLADKDLPNKLLKFFQANQKKPESGSVRLAKAIQLAKETDRMVFATIAKPG